MTRVRFPPPAPRLFLRKIDQDTFDIQKDSGGSTALATIKFSSSEMFNAELKEKDAPISAYLMITSDPLSKLFLAQSKL